MAVGEEILVGGEPGAAVGEDTGVVVGDDIGVAAGVKPRAEKKLFIIIILLHF